LIFLHEFKIEIKVENVILQKKTQQRRKATNNVVSKKQKKQKTKFEYSDNTSDFVSCNSNETTSGHGTLETPEFSFNFKHKSEEKENSFDKWVTHTVLWNFTI